MLPRFWPVFLLLLAGLCYGLPGCLPFWGSYSAQGLPPATPAAQPWQGKSPLRITLILPKDYRGLVWLEFLPAEHGLSPDENRVACKINGRGYAAVPFNPHVQSFFAHPECVAAQYEDGTPIPGAAARDDQVSLHWLTGSGRSPMLWVVGTKFDVRQARPHLFRPTGDLPPFDTEVHPAAFEAGLRAARGNGGN